MVTSTNGQPQAVGHIATRHNVPDAERAHGLARSWHTPKRRQTWTSRVVNTTDKYSSSPVAESQLSASAHDVMTEWHFLPLAVIATPPRSERGHGPCVALPLRNSIAIRRLARLPSFGVHVPRGNREHGFSFKTAPRASMSYVAVNAAMRETRRSHV